MKYSIAILYIGICLVSAKGERLSDIKNKYDNIQSIQGNFIQTLCSSEQGTCQQFEGKFYIAKPYFSRLEVTSPEKQLIITDTANLYIYLIDKKKVYVQPASASMNFFKIFEMMLDDTTRFNLTSKTDKYYTFQSKKDSLNRYSSSFEDMKFVINSKTNLIEQFSYVDYSGNETEFQLSKIKTNERLASKLFKFTMPKGVEIIQ